MTENKRFIAKPETVSYEDTKTGEIFRPKYEMGFYKLLNAMNDFADENEQLKQQVNCHKSRIQLLSSLLDLADTIIDLSDDEKAKAFWEKRNNEVEQEWNKILKGDME